MTYWTEAQRQMAELRRESSGDAEAAHVEADELLVEVLRKFLRKEGLDDFLKDYEEMEKWYA